MAASLYWCHYRKMGNKVLDCLKRAIKIADICMNQAKNLYLFAIILNKYIYYYHYEAEFVIIQTLLIVHLGNE